MIIDSSATRVLLGTALLFQAAVILRYISYFNQLNVSEYKGFHPGLITFFFLGGGGWSVLGVDMWVIKEERRIHFVRTICWSFAYFS